MFIKVNVVGEPKNLLWINTALIEVVQGTTANTAAVRCPQNVWYEAGQFTAQQLVEKLNEWASHG